MKRIVIALLALWGSVGYAQENGVDMFDDSYLHEIRITFTQVDFWDSLEYYYTQYLDFGAEKQYMMASIEIDGTTLDSIGVREKGYYSNWGSEGLKEPLKVSFKTYKDDQRYDGLKKINLANGFKDPSMMRDALAYKFMRDAGIPAPRTSFAKVYLNNTYWGLYVVVEQVDNRFLKNWFDDNDGNLFKCVDNTNLTWQGNTPASYQDEFELRTNTDANDWSGFIDLVDKINTASEFGDSIDTRFKIHDYLEVLAADVLMLNWDSYYDHGRNFYLYQDSLTEMFHWIPWDYNLAFSESQTNILLNGNGGGGGGSKPLIQNVMNDDWYRDLYYHNMCIMLEETFTLANLEPYLDAQKALISAAVDDDPNKFYTFNDFNNNFNSDVTITDSWGFTENVKGLKPFITNRYQTVHSQFANHNHTCTSLGVESKEELGENSIYPNPSNGIFNMNLSHQIKTIEVYNIDGKLLFTETNIYPNMTIDLSGYSSGVYLVNLIGESNNEMVKLIRQ